jgi:hypothetical protein
MELLKKIDLFVSGGLRGLRDSQFTVIYYNENKQKKEVDVNLGPNASPEDYVDYVEKNYKVSPQGIVRVEDRNGKVLWRYTEKKLRGKKNAKT